MRVLLVPDVKGWAWDFKARSIKENLPQYDIDILYNHQIANKWQEYDSVHCFGWPESISIARSVTVGVSSHNFETLHMSSAKSNLPNYRALSAVSERIYKRLKELDMNRNIYLCPNGVNENFFIPADKVKRNDKLIIGWQGKEGGLLDQHGWSTILMPLKEQIKKDPRMELRIINRIYTNALSREEMVKFFQEIDVFLHTGLMTGTPNPIFEAASCGKAVICSRIGAAEQMIKEGVSGFIINLNPEDKVYASLDKLCPSSDKIVKSFMDKLRLLRDDREICENLGKEGRKIIEADWTWKKRVQAYIPLLEDNKR